MHTEHKEKEKYIRHRNEIQTFRRRHNVTPH
jgi:hypothetical protein